MSNLEGQNKDHGEYEDESTIVVFNGPRERLRYLALNVVQNNIGIHLDYIFPREVDSSRDAEPRWWLDKYAPWPVKPMKFAFRYIHAHNLYNNCKVDIKKFVQCIQQHFDTPCATKNEEAQMREKFKDFISECTDHWVGYGFLELEKGGLRKREEFEKEWTLRRSQWDGEHGIELDQRLLCGTKRNMDGTKAETSNSPACNPDKPAKRRKTGTRFNYKAAHFEEKSWKYNDDEEDTIRYEEGIEEDEEDAVGDGEGTKEDEEDTKEDEEDTKEHEEAERVCERERQLCAILELYRIQMSKFGDDEVHKFYERLGRQWELTQIWISNLTDEEMNYVYETNRQADNNLFNVMSLMAILKANNSTDLLVPL